MKIKILKNIKLKNLTFSNQNWNKKNKNPEKSENPKNNSENPKILKSFQKILPKKFQKSIIFLIDFSLTPAGVPFPLEQSLILLGRIRASGRLSNNKELVHFHSQLTTKY